MKEQTTMTYNFDTLIDRHGYDAMKTDELKHFYGRDDLIPLWVADMDFATPPFIIEALRRRLDHPILGYPLLPVPPAYYPVIKSWEAYKHGWNIEENWIHYIPGIVKGIGLVINVFTQPGDRIIVQTPVYHPFRLVPENNGREVLFNPLTLADGQYSMDLDHLESIIDERCKLLILCNPHNPVGIVWPAEVLTRLAETCHRHHLLVVSDEIHAEIIHRGYSHHPFASVSDVARHISITFQAPSKTFNIAGVVSSYCIVPDDDLRRRFFGFLDANELDGCNIFSYIATMAAYTEGKDWLRQMVQYVEANADFVIDYLQRYIPRIKTFKPQASFLVWLDCRELHLTQAQLNDFFVNQARLALNDGEMFGPDGTGTGFMRLNIGTPRPLLKRALDQLRDATSSLQ